MFITSKTIAQIIVKYLPIVAITPITIVMACETAPKIEGYFTDECIVQGRVVAKNRSTDRWGYLNAQGQEVSAFKYDMVSVFNEHGYGMVELNNAYGLMDTQGDIIFPTEYQKIRFIDKETIIIKKEGAYGVSKINGESLIPLQYDNIRPFGNKFIVKENNLEGIIDISGNVIIPSTYKSIYTDADYQKFSIAILVKQGEVNKKYSFTNTEGKVLIPFIDKVLLSGASDGKKELQAVVVDGKVGMIDLNTILTGDENTPLTFNVPNEFDGIVSGNTSLQKDGPIGVKKDGKWGFIDATGKTVIPFIYDKASTFKEGIARVKKNGKHIRINRKGKQVKQ